MKRDNFELDSIVDARIVGTGLCSLAFHKPPIGSGNLCWFLIKEYDGLLKENPEDLKILNDWFPIFSQIESLEAHKKRFIEKCLIYRLHGKKDFNKKYFEYLLTHLDCFIQRETVFSPEVVSNVFDNILKLNGNDLDVSAVPFFMLEREDLRLGENTPQDKQKEEQNNHWNFNPEDMGQGLRL